MFEIVKTKICYQNAFILEESICERTRCSLENELDSFEEESIHIIGYDKNMYLLHVRDLDLITTQQK